MIAPNTKVLILDIDEQEVIQNTIENVYISFAHLLQNKGEDNSEIDLSQKRIVITDWTGWTKIYAIGRHKNHLPWYRLSTTDNIRDVSLAEGTEYPAYIPTSRKHGFHGEVLYKYINLRIPSTYSDEHCIRAKGFNDEDGIIKQFSQYTIELTQQKEYGYTICTKSGFFNANGIHLLHDAHNKETGYK